MNRRFIFKGPSPRLIPSTRASNIPTSSRPWAASYTLESSLPYRRWNTTITTTPPRTALFFPGHGVQRVGMTLPWLESFPRTVQPLLDEVDSILKFSLSKIIREGPSSAISTVEHSQPAILATSIIILRVLEQEFGFQTSQRVHFTLGHSLGEFSALVAAGHLSFQDALRVVRRRAEVMADITRVASSSSSSSSSDSERDGPGRTAESPYGMIALVCEKPEHLPPLLDSIESFLSHTSSSTMEDIPPIGKDEGKDMVGVIEEVSIANMNAKNQIVLSGKIQRIKILLTHLRQFGGHDPRAVRLNTDCAFHSPMMRPAEGLMRGWLSGEIPLSSSSSDEVRTRRAGMGKEGMIKWPPTGQSEGGDYPECISTITARPFASREDVIDLLSRQCSETVLWSESIRYLDQERNVRRWLGIGPGLVGRNLVGKEVGMRSSDSSFSETSLGVSEGGSSSLGGGRRRELGRDRDGGRGRSDHGNGNGNDAGRKEVIKGGGVWGISDPRDIEAILKALDQTEVAV